ncbi:MAG: iron-sulfur cluster assembly accessory protein [bacterium]|nr:iron-sulfur cluster assembly accessory protein [bacterium]
MSAGITITPSATEKVHQLMSEENMGPDYFVRVSVKGGGCSGLSYDLDFDNERKESDQEFLNGDVKIICDLKSYLYLAGTELDFTDGLNGKGFNFVNPNAKRTCGCGESFAV